MHSIQSRLNYETTKKLGIYMDHSVVHLIDLNSHKKNTDIESSFKADTKEEALNRSYNLMHNKR
jgi:hypothetical protein